MLSLRSSISIFLQAIWFGVDLLLYHLQQVHKRITDLEVSNEGSVKIYVGLVTSS